MAARASAAQLRAVGLPELVATSYWSNTSRSPLNLARDRHRLARLRPRLRHDGRASPLFDMAAYTRAFEAALERMARAGGLRAGAGGPDGEAAGLGP